jgi:hypothetical protein
MANEDKKVYSWNLINTVIAILGIVIGALGIWLTFHFQSIQTKRSDKEKLVEHLQAIIPDCKGFTNQLGENAAILAPCYNCMPYNPPCRDCDQSRNPVQNPLLYHHYTECKRVAEGIPDEMSGFDYMLMAIAAERIGFYSEANTYFLLAEQECEKSLNKSDDLIVLVNHGHFEYMRTEKFDGLSLGDPGEYEYKKALAMVDDVYGTMSSLGRAEILAQWSFDTFLLGFQHQKGVERASEAARIFKKHRTNEPRLQNLWTQLTYIGRKDDAVKFWLREALDSGIFPSDFVDPFDRPYDPPSSGATISGPFPSFGEGYVPPQSAGEAPTYQPPTRDMEPGNDPTFPIFRETITLPLNSNGY